MASANSLEDAAEHLQRNRAVVFEAETACFNMFNCTDVLINSLGCPVVGIERLLVFHRNFMEFQFPGFVLPYNQSKAWHIVILTFDISQETWAIP